MHQSRGLVADVRDDDGELVDAYRPLIVVAVGLLGVSLFEHMQVVLRGTKEDIRSGGATRQVVGSEELVERLGKERSCRFGNLDIWERIFPLIGATNRSSI